MTARIANRRRCTRRLGCWGRRAVKAMRVLCLFAASLARSGELPPESASSDGDGAQLFVAQIEPLLRTRCVNCHNADLAEGGLRLDSRDALLAGGDSGPAVVPGDAERSLLVMAVAKTHASLEMPPEEGLPPEQVTLLARWVKLGAPWPATQPITPTQATPAGERIGDAWSDPRNPIVQLYGGARLDLWSLRPVVRPEVPATTNAAWAKNDLDRFVLARMEREGVEPKPMADARTIVRRLYFDLTGLPPSWEQANAFTDRARTGGFDAAVAELVDELLASPRYGEHFARMWLDEVRYSDSNGFDWDEFRPQAWRFRDYVVRSLNADKPFDQFTREQLAGDELLAGPPRDAAEQDCLIATGYLRLGPYDNAAPLFNESDRSRAELLADVTETTAAAFLGLTFSCCRCHDHKYDPLSQADHYRFRAFFAAMRFADDTSLDLADEQAAIEAHNALLDAEAKPLKERAELLGEQEQAAREELEKAIAAIDARRRPYTTGLLMTDDATNVAATHVLFQGDHKALRDAVDPGVPSVFDPQPAEFVPTPNEHSTGRRLTLARWITSPANPLTARVFVNRVWRQLMGRGLVETPNDFGLAGAPPEDAALLDWLADEFIANGWSVKKLVRQIATSAAYLQSPSFDRKHMSLRSPRRLQAEQLRDALLHAGGLLTLKSGGPPVWPELPPEVLTSNPAFFDDNAEHTKGWYPSPKNDQSCRSLFLVQKRNTRVPILEAFDLPDNSAPCPRREQSTTAPQALMLLNNALTIEAAQGLADRVQYDAGHDVDRQIARIFEIVLQRRPTAGEAEACRRLLATRSLTELCRAMLNVNEFVYLD
jgi:hypothetical protein